MGQRASKTLCKSRIWNENAIINKPHHSNPMTPPLSPFSSMTDKSEGGELDSPPDDSACIVRVVHQDLIMHLQVTTELNLKIPMNLTSSNSPTSEGDISLSQATEEDLVTAVAHRNIDFSCWSKSSCTRTCCKQDQVDEQGKLPALVAGVFHFKRINLVSLSNCTDAELRSEISRRRLRLYNEVDANLVMQNYQIHSMLGRGTSAQVFACVNKRSGRHYACKVVSRDDDMNDAQSMSTEIEIMKRLRHRHIVAMYELFESPHCMWLILELVDAGTLRSLVTTQCALAEPIAASIMSQVLSGIHYLHSMGVVHRDIKPENILLKRIQTGSGYEIKIADFGLSALLRVGYGGYDQGHSGRRKSYTALTEPWGTADYEAPEVLTQAYGPQVDAWACGCLLYEMLGGQKAFFRREGEPNRVALQHRILRAEFDFRRPVWWSVSASAKNLICALLTVDPLERLTASEAAAQPWLNSYDAGRQFWCSTTANTSTITASNTVSSNWSEDTGGYGKSFETPRNSNSPNIIEATTADSFTKSEVFHPSHPQTTPQIESSLQPHCAPAQMNVIDSIIEAAGATCSPLMPIRLSESALTLKSALKYSQTHPQPHVQSGQRLSQSRYFANSQRRHVTTIRKTSTTLASNYI